MTNPDLQEAIEAAERLSGRVEEHTRAVDDLVREFRVQQKWTRRRVRGIIAVLCVMSLLLAGVALTVHYTAQVAACTRAYSDANAGRSTALAPLARARDKAQDEFNKSLATQNQEVIRPIYERMVAADNAYENAYDANPPVLGPQHRC